MNEFDQLMQSIKSAKEATVEQLQSVYKRYDSMMASGNAENNEVFLHQQNINLQVTDSTLSTKELEEIFEKAGVKYDKAYEGRVKLYKASDETVDSAGDIIRQGGWDFSRYKMNPVFAYSHDYDTLPIGKGIKWYVKDGALYIYNMFALPEANPWADMCLNLVNAQMLNGNSVGFIPKKVTRIEDENERAKLGLGRYGVIFEKSLLLEDSACALGCNPSALVQDTLTVAVQKGIITKDSMTRIVNSDSEPNIPESLKIAVDRALLMVNKTLSVQVKETTLKDVVNEIKEIKADNTLGETLNEIKTEIQSIKTDMANIQSKLNDAGNSGNTPDTETEAEKELYDLIADGINGVSKLIEKNLNKE